MRKRAVQLANVLLESVIQHFDLAVVGVGIVGLVHARAAAVLGKRVIVSERGACSIGASVHDFGFVTVTGQQAAVCWQRARRSRNILADVAVSADMPVEHRGLVTVARRHEAMDVLEAFRGTGPSTAFAIGEEVIRDMLGIPKTSPNGAAA